VFVCEACVWCVVSKRPRHSLWRREARPTGATAFLLFRRRRNASPPRPGSIVPRPATRRIHSHAPYPYTTPQALRRRGAGGAGAWTQCTALFSVAQSGTYSHIAHTHKPTRRWRPDDKPVCPPQARPLPPPTALPRKHPPPRSPRPPRPSMRTLPAQTRQQQPRQPPSHSCPRTWRTSRGARCWRAHTTSSKGPPLASWWYASRAWAGRIGTLMSWFRSCCRRDSGFCDTIWWVEGIRSHHHGRAGRHVFATAWPARKIHTVRLFVFCVS